MTAAVLDAEETAVEMTSLRARATALEEDKKALEDELPHLRGRRLKTLRLPILPQLEQYYGRSPFR